MNIEETKKIIQNKIQADEAAREVRSQIKTYIHEKQNLREGFQETFKSLIETSEKVKESIDTQQNKLIKQLQENQLALTSGFEGNRKAITSGFDKMDEVKRWDLSQLPGYESTLGMIEKPKKEDDEDEEEPVEEEKIIEEIKVLQNLLLEKNDLMAKLIEESKAKYQDGNINDANKLLKEADNQKESIESLERKIRRLYQYLGDEEEESVGKPKSVAHFEFEDFDKGLNYKEARDILKEFGLRRLPSEYKDQSIEKNQ